MGLLVFAVPALLVVVLGYVVGYGLWSAVAGPQDAEVAGWLTGLLLLVAVSWVGFRLWRRSRR